MNFLNQSQKSAAIAAQQKVVDDALLPENEITEENLEIAKEELEKIKEATIVE